MLDWLGQGGSEQLLWELISRSDKQRVRHRIVTVYPHEPVYVMANRMHAVGAYDLTTDTQTPVAPATNGGAASVNLSERGAKALRLIHRISVPVLHRLPEAWKRPIWDAEDVLLALPRVHAEFRHQPPDIIHSHVFSGFRAGVALHYLTRRPHVHTVTGMFEQLRRLGQERQISQFRRFRRTVARWFIADEYRNDLHGIGVEEDHIGGLRGVIDVAQIAAVREQAERYRLQIRRELGLSDSAILGLSVGRFHASKGHQYSVEALPRILTAFPDFHWIALGQGKPQESYERRARELGVAGHAHVLGFRDDPLPYYAAADVYLRTPIIEADTLSSFNAMAMGTPTVGFDTGGATELMRKVGHGILVANSNAVALADGVLQILRQTDRGRALSARGIEYAERHLDIAPSIEEFVRSYERVLRSSSAGTLT